MTLQTTHGDFKAKEQDVIFAYGFDATGFPARHEIVDLERQAVVEFLNFYSPTSLDPADGVIIPQGIFEKVDTHGLTPVALEIPSDQNPNSNCILPVSTFS